MKIRAKHKKTLQIKDFWFNSIEEAKKQNPDFEEFIEIWSK